MEKDDMRLPTQEEAKRIFESAFVEVGELEITKINSGFRLDSQPMQQPDGKWKNTMTILNFRKNGHRGGWYAGASNHQVGGTLVYEVAIELKEVLAALECLND